MPNFQLNIITTKEARVKKTVSLPLKFPEVYRNFNFIKEILEN